MRSVSFQRLGRIRGVVAVCVPVDRWRLMIRRRECVMVWRGTKSTCSAGVCRCCRTPRSWHMSVVAYRVGTVRGSLSHALEKSRACPRSAMASRKPREPRTPKPNPNWNRTRRGHREAVKARAHQLLLARKGREWYLKDEPHVGCRYLDRTHSGLLGLGPVTQIHQRTTREVCVVHPSGPGEDREVLVMG